MAIVTVWGETGCRIDELSRLVGLRMRYEVVGEAGMASLLADEYGESTEITDKAWAPAALSVLARLAAEHDLVVAIPGAETMFRNLRGVLRIYLIAREAYRAGNLLLDERIDRLTAQRRLTERTTIERQIRKARFGRARPIAEHFDLVFNAESYEPARIVDMIEAAAAAARLPEHGLLSHAAEAQLQFQVRLQLARHGIIPAGKAKIGPKQFGHPSEELFANLLDFYHIAWEHEPRSFPLQWDKNGKVIEAFTPDFYLPEMDLYVELTTMKQALVTKKNRKIKLLRAIYPHVNIQVFYQKDFQDLVMKYGLSERVPG